MIWIVANTETSEPCQRRTRTKKAMKWVGSRQQSIHKILKFSAVKKHHLAYYDDMTANVATAVPKLGFPFSVDVMDCRFCVLFNFIELGATPTPTQVPTQWYHEQKENRFFMRSFFIFPPSSQFSLGCRLLRCLAAPHRRHHRLRGQIFSYLNCK